MEEELQLGEREIHPLLNPVVLKRLFEVVPFTGRTFKTLRLVSSAWLDASLPIWRANAWLRVHQGRKDGNGEESNEDGNNFGIFQKDFMNLLENSELKLTQHPFQKYKFIKWNIHLNSDIETRFWRSVGPLMTHLYIRGSVFARAEDLRQVLFQHTPSLGTLSLIQNEYRDKRPEPQAQRLDPKLPRHAPIEPELMQKNLVELKISTVDIFKNNLSITWLELLLHFPSIKKLGTVRHPWSEFGDDELQEFFTTVQILRQKYDPQYLRNVQSLGLMRAFRPLALSASLMDLISSLQFPLKHLSLTVPAMVEETTFKRLLESCASSLEQLSVTAETNNTIFSPYPNFPFGLKLSKMTVLAYAGPFTANLMFLNEWTNLEMLCIIPLYETKLDQYLTQVVTANQTKLVNLKTLSIGTNSPLGQAEISKLGQLMPNVKGLTVALNSEGFREVCQFWKELEYLEIFRFEITEDGMLGKGNGGNFQYPNITDLKNLKFFEMEMLGDDPLQCALSEDVILHGILQLEKLEMVVVCVAYWVSLEVQNQLKEKIPGHSTICRSTAPRFWQFMQEAARLNYSVKRLNL